MKLLIYLFKILIMKKKLHIYFFFVGKLYLYLRWEGKREKVSVDVEENREP